VSQPSERKLRLGVAGLGRAFTVMLPAFTADARIALVEKYGIPYHEKTLGQLFCDRSARDILNMLEVEGERAGVKVFLNTKIEEIKFVSRLINPIIHNLAHFKEYFKLKFSIKLQKNNKMKILD